MKKIILFLTIFSLIYFVGCSASYKVNFFDEITGKPINPVIINGKIAQGEIKLPPNTYKVSANNYEEKSISVNKDNTNFFLKPSAYLVLEANAKVNSIKIDDKYYKPTSIITNGHEVFTVSPVEIGTHTIIVESKFFVPFSKEVEFKYGENHIVINLTVDKGAFSQFLDTLEFPLQGTSNKKIIVKINGIANKNPISKEFKIEKSSDTLAIIDGNLTYSFKNGTFEIEGRTPTEEEKAILSYAKSVIEEFLNLKNVLKSMELKEAKDNEFLLSKTGAFEGREITESLSFKVDNSKITSIVLNIVQEQINTNLRIEVEVE
ncbi:hypothetical protein [Caldisericum exile]|uniref:Uncharacterized protein n=1 Tax=Caldisericum exile (strain DSM 21853 / NBRC 104410 / AZM16c01) TaxID=511051 RepID=A0A7U6GFL3_CALEA|nr:hypothetical protein [Caldisericum exile]BAL81416.1 hypothetical protein CSE_12900 [Caldisericum exile AZM16c01]